MMVKDLWFWHLFNDVFVVSLSGKCLIQFIQFGISVLKEQDKCYLFYVQIT